MNDKKKNSKTDTKDPEFNKTMVPFEFTYAELDEHFPNVLGEYYGFALIKDVTELKAYLCAEEVNATTVSLHIWIPEDLRSKETILWLKDLLHTDVKAWAHSIGKPVITASCPFDYIKTKNLLDTFGFNLTPLWIGVIDTRED